MEVLESIKNLSKDNGAIKSLRELLTLTMFGSEELSRFYNFRRNVQNGQKIGWIGQMSDIGWAGAKCNPEYRKPTISAAEKTWDIGDWSAPLKWCYEDFLNTVAEYALKQGTAIGDLTSTDIMDVVIMPALEDAMSRMYWRFIWFGDKDTTSDCLSAGVDVELFKPCDGLFKQLFAIGAANPAQRVTIAANQEDTYSAQMAAIKQPGVAISIFDALIENADSRIASLDGAGIMCTKSMADALAKDLKREYKDILAWEDVFRGVRMTEYNGVTIYAISVWDRMIAKYQNNGIKANLPHRAVFGAPSQMLVGSPADSVVSSLEVWFNQDERVVKSYLAGRLGCLIGEDELFNLAY